MRIDEQRYATTVAIVPREATERSYWLSVLERLAQPVLEHLAKGELRKRMPVETGGIPRERRAFTHLEAFGRLMTGIAPWLETPGLGDAEREQQRRSVALAQQALDRATDPRSRDFLNFDRDYQPLVDAAYLAQGILRAPNVLWEDLNGRVRRQVVQALLASRVIPNPVPNNWVLFAAMIEAALLVMGQPTREERLEQRLRQMLGWYQGDGHYGDGPFFHCDSYNSFVINPMLVDVLAVLDRHDPRFRPAYEIVLGRARRYAEIQERSIAPDGTFPLVGRSATYRCGAFHALAQMALLRQLPEQVRPAQVRGALTAVMRRMLEAPGTFDADGWLRIGFCGHQVTLAEDYVSTGSLYLCSAALLPLGLPPQDPFWADPPAPWTSQRLWRGEALPADEAMADTADVAIPTLCRGRPEPTPSEPRRDRLAFRLLPTCRRTLGRLIARSPLPELIFRQRSRQSLTVIAYHRIAARPDARYPFDDDVISATPEEFARELRFFQRHLDLISVTELLAGIEDPRMLPERPAVITFDDGYRDNYEVALPLLRERGLTACFFVCTALLGRPEIPWWDQVACCFKHSRTARIRSPFGAEDRPYATDPGQRQRSTRRFLHNLTRCPWSGVTAHLEELKRTTGVNPAEYVTRPLFMSWDEVRAMEAAGMEIGSHTRTHPVLGQIEDPLVLRDEIAGSYRDLQHALGHVPLAFAYPVGTKEAMLLEADTEIARAGYRISFSYQHGLAIPARGRCTRVPRIHAEFGEDHAAFRLGVALAPRLACAWPAAVLALSHVAEGAVGW